MFVQQNSDIEDESILKKKLTLALS